MPFRHSRSLPTKKPNKPKKIKLKEIRIRPKIGDHDLQVKLRQATKFLEKGNQVRITVMYRGREASVSRPLAEEKLNKFLELGKPTSTPKWSGNRYSVVIA
ncbi:MAG: translation initiation factor IF-3 [Candidatus Thorarchaeota archaeon]